MTRGGDRVTPIPPDQDDPWEKICGLVECLLGSDRLREVLDRQRIDKETLLECLASDVWAATSAESRRNVRSGETQHA